MRSIIIGIQRKYFQKEITQHMSAKIRNNFKVDIHFKSIDTLKGIDAEVVVVDAELFVQDIKDISSSIKWAQFTWAGIENVAHKIVKEPSLKDNLKNLTATRLGNAFANKIAEYCIAAVLNMERQFLRMNEDQKNKIWRNPAYAEKVTR